jgi:hypothetical protein
MFDKPADSYGHRFQVSEFAPPRLQKQLSYGVGWLCALGWQAAMPAVRTFQKLS